MINFTDMTGLASSAVVITAMAVRTPGVARLQRPYLALFVCAIAIAALIPFGGLPLAAYVRGVTGDLSITSLVLLLMAISHLICMRPQRTELYAPSPAGGGLGWGGKRGRYALLILVILAAIGLYPMALGLGYFDPYRLGYGNLWMLGSLLLIALTACLRRLPVIALAIGLAVLAWGVGWYESGNLWDYLLDPLLAIYAIGALLKQGAQSCIRPQRS